MAPCSTSMYVSVFLLLLLDFLLFVGAASAAKEFPSFGFQRFDKGSNFEAQFALFGDAKIDNGGAFLQITEPLNLSAGRVMYREPIKLRDGNPRGEKSFGTYFTFSLSPEAGDGLAFLMVPNDFAKRSDGDYVGLSYELVERKFGAFAVEFDTKMDAKYGDLNGNHVGIDVNSLVSVKVSNASHAKLVLNSGGKLQCWIDYEATSKHIEVRLSKFGGMRPIEPLLSCRIDLAEYFKNEEVWFGLSSSNANSSQICKVYSWSFKLRPVPYWMHSQPLNPEAFSKDVEPVKMHTKSDCYLRVFTAIIVGTLCGAMGAFIVLLVWTFFSSRWLVMPEEFVSPKVEYDCDKVKVFVVEKPLKESMN